MKGSTIQSLWFGKPLTAMEILCMKSFVYHDHPFHLYVYDDDVHMFEGIVPNGVEIKDANDIVDKKLVDKFIYNKDNSDNKHIISKRTLFSDYFRYNLLYKNGEIWVDMDMIALRPFDFDDDFVFSSERKVWSRHTHEWIRFSNDDPRAVATINSGVIKVPKGSECMKYCIDKCNELVTNNYNRSSLKWGDLGPRLTSDMITVFGLAEHVKSPETFCPIHYRDISGVLVPGLYKEVTILHSDWYAIHLWNEHWYRSVLSKNGPHAKMCLYERLLKQYRVERPYSQSINK